MTIYKTFSDLTDALLDDSVTDKNRIINLIRLYTLAQETAKEYGYIGVGCISYAQEALYKYQTEGK